MTRVQSKYCHGVCHRGMPLPVEIQMFQLGVGGKTVLLNHGNNMNILTIDSFRNSVRRVMRI